MRRLFSFLLLLLLLLPTAGAAGDPNADGSGGTMGNATDHGRWSLGNDGIRVTVMKGQAAAAPSFDIANKKWDFCIGYVKRNKLLYKDHGYTLREAEIYTNYELPEDLRMERIINKKGASNIGFIRSYFTDQSTIEYVALKSGIPYDELVGGDYKLLLEPMAYFIYEGSWYAMTATEASLFDVTVHGKLSHWMGSLTHTNLPLALFLEKPDLGIAPWTRTDNNKKHANIDILKQLGVGVISFHPEVEPPMPELGDYQYYTDTDVITACVIPNNTRRSLPPDWGAYAIFKINGETYQAPYICPAGSRQLVWVRWHTPDRPQTLTASVYCPAVGIREADAFPLAITVSALEEKEPPDPVYDGPGIGAGQYIPNFRLTDPPRWGERSEVSWSEWRAESETFGDYVVWNWYRETTTAKLTVDYQLLPNERVQTDFHLSDGSYEMKSGYGVDVECQVRVARSDGADLYDVTPVQHVLAVFPEFYYKDYNRFLEPDDAGRYRYRTTWRFRPNPCSYYGCRTHFTPLWYPNGMDYPVQLAVFDAWTPGGQLYATVTDAVRIDGGACLDDWYIRPY